MSFKGTITTTGPASEAIRLDKALFKAHPEFRQKAKVEAHVIGKGYMLISLSEPELAEEQSDDPVVGVFLSFLERDLEDHPERIQPLSRTRINDAEKLVQDVAVSDDEELPDDLLR